MNWNNNTNMSNIFTKGKQKFFNPTAKQKHFQVPKMLATDV